MPQITESFTVDRPVEVVWQFFQNVPEVAACMPGVELGESLDNNAYKGKMKVKLGPISAEFQGQATIEDLNEANRTGSISAKGADRKGGSRASAKVQYALSNAAAGTKVDIAADLHLQGAMAQFGRTGLIQEVSSHLTKEFAGCIEQKLAAQTPAEAGEVKAGEVKGIRVFLQGIWGWIKSLFDRKSTS
jgi:uncharacterized protein